MGFFVTEGLTKTKFEMIATYKIEIISKHICKEIQILKKAKVREKVLKFF